jgi:membrane-bound lytic murein transglycosylase D
MPLTRYRVATGDSVASVARQFNTNIDVIRVLNDLPAGKLTLGADLSVPAPVVLPPKVARAAELFDRPERRVHRHGHIHVVKRGDSLWAIAQRSGMDVNKLASLNGMEVDSPLHAGQHIKLVSTSSVSSAGAGSSAGPRPMTYVVRSGDTLSKISRLFQVSIAQISRWNSLATPPSLSPGQKLIIRVLNRHS